MLVPPQVTIPTILDCGRSVHAGVWKASGRSLRVRWGGSIVAEKKPVSRAKRAPRSEWAPREWSQRPVVSPGEELTAGAEPADSHEREAQAHGSALELYQELAKA